MKVKSDITPRDAASRAERFIETAAPKVASRIRRWDAADGAPVITVDGKYTSRAWTEWTEGFQVGAALLIYEATGDRAFLDMGLQLTDALIPKHVSHTGVHDHGFNVVSTYGALRRLAMSDQLPENAEGIRQRAELALKVSGAIQAARWTPVAGEAGGGFVHSFNGPHSLFVDTMRSLRSLFLAHRLGHALLGEGDERINLLDRAVSHARTTARYAVYYGEGRDIYDVRGRVAHEAIFNTVTGAFRSPNSQQGYSPFTTWTRGASWAILGFAEVLEALDALAADQSPALSQRADATRSSAARPDEAAGEPPSPRSAPTDAAAPSGPGTNPADVTPSSAARPDEAAGEPPSPGSVPTDAAALSQRADATPSSREPRQGSTSRSEEAELQRLFLKAATAAADRYIDGYTAADGVPPWDDGAPGLVEMAGYTARDSDPWESPEPFDSSAAAIAAQGLLRLGRWLGRHGHAAESQHYAQAGLTVANTLFDEPYLSTAPSHEGLLLHSIYHRPNGWDHIPVGMRSPCGESSTWGDYHALELALLILRMAEGGFLEWR